MKITTISRLLHRRSLGKTVAGPTPPSTPPDLLAAVKAAFAANSGLVAALPSGLYFVRPARKASYPYAMFQAATRGLARTSSTSKFRNLTLTFTLYGPNLDVLAPIGDQLEDAFKNTRLGFAGGYTGPLVIGDRTFDQPRGTRDSSGNDLWCVMVGFNAVMTRGT